MNRWTMTRTPLAALTLVTLTMVALLGVLAGCATASTGAARQTAPTSTPTVPATTQGRLTQRVRQAEGAAAKSVELTYDEAIGAVEVMVTLNWSPAWKTQFSQAQAAAKKACYEAQAALWTSGVTLNKVTVTVLGQTLDDYGEVMTGAYAAATLTSAHASAMAWNTTSVDVAWSHYDDVFLRPLYGSDWMYPRPTTPPASSDTPTS